MAAKAQGVPAAPGVQPVAGASSAAAPPAADSFQPAMKPKAPASTTKDAKAPQQSSPPGPPAADQVTGPATTASSRSSMGASAPAQPSFDCGKAHTLIESLICADPKLAAMDVDLSQAYKAAVGQSTDKEALKSAQLRWLKSRNQCTTPQCVGTAYAERLAALGH
jgi:uncharacterized protein YecT (DUF1311 family)